MERWDRDRDWRDRWRDDDDRSRSPERRERYDEEIAHERDPRWGGIPGYHAGGDFGWRGTELDRGFGGRYEYDRDRDRNVNRDYDRERYSASDRERYSPERNRDYGRYDRERSMAGEQYGRNEPYRNDAYRRDMYREEISRGRGEQQRYSSDDRYRTMSGDPYRDRGYERSRDYERDRDRNRETNDRDRGDDYWDNYPWSRRW